MANKQFDVVVIGAGPGGYIAAIRAAQLGLSTACIESESYADPKGEVRLGGTCLNVGCIPSKALLRSSRTVSTRPTTASSCTASRSKASRSMSAPWSGARTTSSPSSPAASAACSRRTRSRCWPGAAVSTGREDESWQVEVAGKDGTEVVEAKHVIVATGSSARHLDGIPVDNQVICDNAGALSFDSVPKRLGVIGAGVIGLELGSVWKRLGSEVTILEALPDFLAAADPAVAKEAWKTFTQKQGLKIHLGVKIGTVKQGKKGVTVDYENGEGAQKLECDRLIVSVGRVPNTAGLGADNVGLKLDERGRVDVNDHCQTNLENVWAVGDVIRGPMLAHKGMEEGVMVAELIAGQAGHVNYDAIPWVIYTHPEIAWVGKTETQLKNEGVDYRVGPDSLPRQRPRAGAGRHHRLRQAAGRCAHRPHPRRPCDRRQCLGADRRGRGGDGVRRFVGGHRAHLPCPSDAVGDHARGGARGREARAAFLT